MESDLDFECKTGNSIPKFVPFSLFFFLGNLYYIKTMFKRKRVKIIQNRNLRKNGLKIGIFRIEFPVLDAKLRFQFRNSSVLVCFFLEILYYIKTMFKKK